MAWLKSRRLPFWILVTALLSAASYVVDVNTGAKTGPPYDDPWYNLIAFLVNRLSLLVLFALVLISLGLLARRLARRPSTRRTD